jgi:hypothetical protein
MHWLRTRLRTLMAAIVLLAIMMGAWRALQFVSVAANHRTMARGLRSMASGFRNQASDPSTPPSIAADFARDAEEMEEVASRYERAASRPWLPISFKPKPDQ